MSATVYNTIHLKGDFQHEEGIASAAFTPGNLVALLSTGKYAKHATEGGYAELIFAAEDALQGKAKDDAYAANDIAMLAVEEPTNQVYAFIKAGQNVAIGDQLISAGDGTLKRAAGAATGVTVKQIIAVAMEALDLTATGAVATRLAVRLK